MSDVNLDGLTNKQDLGRFVAEYLEQNPLPMSAVDGLQTAAGGGNPQPLPFAADWVNYGLGYAPGTYRTVPGGGIVLDGLVKKATGFEGGSVVAQLPEGVRPKEREGRLGWMSIDSSAGIGVVRVDITAAGEIEVFTNCTDVDYFFLPALLFWPGV